jgi:hypothetical protein
MLTSPRISGLREPFGYLVSLNINWKVELSAIVLLKV